MILCTEEYSSSEESISSNSEEEKASTNIKINMQLNDYKKGHVLGNENCLFASLDQLVFNDNFGSFSLRQLIVNHISDNKELCADDVEGDFDQYKENEKQWWMGWYSRVASIFKYDWRKNWALDEYQR